MLVTRFGRTHLRKFAAQGEALRSDRPMDANECPQRAQVRHANGTSLSDAANCDRTRRSRNAGCSDKRPGEETLKLVPFVRHADAFSGVMCPEINRLAPGTRPLWTGAWTLGRQRRAKSQAISAEKVTAFKMFEAAAASPSNGPGPSPARAECPRIHRLALARAGPVGTRCPILGPRVRRTSRLGTRRSGYWTVARVHSSCHG